MRAVGWPAWDTLPIKEKGTVGVDLHQRDCPNALLSETFLVPGKQGKAVNRCRSLGVSQ